MSQLQQQEPCHGKHESGEQSSSWRERSIKNRLHNSPIPLQRRMRSSSAASTAASVASRPDRHHQQPEQPSGRQHQDSATTPQTTVTGNTSTAPADNCGSGPLEFPTAIFSPALRVIEGESFTLVSKKTGRRWRAINSTRECQFGQVVRAVEVAEEAMAPSTYFAIKELRLERLRRMQGRTHEDPLREVAALQYLDEHLNVLSCTEALVDEVSIYIVTPFYSGGELFDALTNRGRFNESEARPLFRQVLEGLLHLKKHGVCHRDVSLENLLLGEGGVVKLVDFGLAIRIPQTPDGRAAVLPPQGPCGKPYYTAPEVLASSSGFDGFAVDVWACGIVLFILLTGNAPFELALPSQDRRYKRVAIEERLVDLLAARHRSLSPEATDLIQSCLLCSPRRRPSLETLLSHPWLTRGKQPSSGSSMRGASVCSRC